MAESLVTGSELLLALRAEADLSEKPRQLSSSARSSSSMTTNTASGIARCIRPSGLLTSHWRRSVSDGLRAKPLEEK